MDFRAIGRVTGNIVICALVGLIAAPAFAQTAAPQSVTEPMMKSKEAEIRAKIIEIDSAGRTVTVRDPKGKLVSVVVGPETKNFEQLRVGDAVVVRYVSAVVVSVTRGTAGGIRERVESRAVDHAASGSMPGYSGRRTVEVLAVIQSLDRRARKATLRGPRRTVTVDVPDDVDMKLLKVGDEVRALIIEAAAVSVEPQAKR